MNNILKANDTKEPTGYIILEEGEGYVTWQPIYSLVKRDREIILLCGNRKDK